MCLRVTEYILLVQKRFSGPSLQQEPTFETTNTSLQVLSAPVARLKALIDLHNRNVVDIFQCVLTFVFDVGVKSY